MKTLDDFVTSLPNIKLVMYHGLGRGGGEKVSQKIAHAYSKVGNNIQTIPLNKVSKGLYKNLPKQSQISIIMTSGPRDMKASLLAIFAGHKFAVYYQVPYTKAINWRDPLYAVVILAMYLFNWLFAAAVFCNSNNSAPPFGAKSPILLPILNSEIKAQYEVENKNSSQNNSIILTTACRLFPERGKGARDVKALLNLLHNCKFNNSTAKQQIWVEHYGDVHADITKLFTDGNLPIRFLGFQPNWQDNIGDICFFFSHYEGFGLSAFEASVRGHRVVLNEAFPDEIFSVTNNIKRLDLSKIHSHNILGSVLNAHNNIN